MSSRWSSSSCVSGGTLALRAASCVASSRSARSSLRVISTMKPSPMRVGIFASTGISLPQESCAGRRLRGARGESYQQARGRERPAPVDPSAPTATLERKKGPPKHMIRRTLILGATLLAAVCLGAGAAAPARAASPDDEMREA